MTHHKHYVTDINGTKGTVTLASVNTATFLNLIMDAGSSHARLSLSPVDAKKLRDTLNSIYPVDTPKLTGTHSHTFIADDIDTKPALKVGDKVRVSTHRHGYGQQNTVGVITNTGRPGSLPIEVDFTGSPKKAPALFNQYAAHDLELVPVDPDAGRFIVTLLEDGTYKPSRQPLVHLSEKAANAEAERLAKQHGGTFHVMEAIFEASREKAIVPPVKTKTL